ncbi:hypothetical protein Tco_0495981 [Tanacetum coccineum]
MLLNLDQLEKQLDKEEFQEDRPMAAFWMHKGGVETTIAPSTAEEKAQRRKKDLRFPMAMLTMRARRFLKNTGRKLTVNVSSRKVYLTLALMAYFVYKFLTPSEAKASADKPKAVKKNNGAPIIEDWVSDSKEDDMPQAKIQKKIVKPSFAKIEFVKSKEQVPKAVVNACLKGPKAVLKAS